MPDESPRIELWKKFYEDGHLPISGLARLRGRPDHQVYEGLVSGLFAGVVACSQNSDFLLHQPQILEHATAFCLESTTLLGLAKLDRLDSLASAGKPIYISQFLLDDLRQELLDIRRTGTKERRSLVRINGRVEVIELTEEQMSERADFLGRLISWLVTNAPVRPEALHVRDQLKQVEPFLTPAAFGSLVIARQEGALLMSEDLTLRNIASQFFSIEGSWSFPFLLIYSKHDDDLSDGETLLVKLFRLNYRHLPLTEDLLVKAFALDMSQVGAHVESVLQVAANPSVRLPVVTEMIAVALRHACLTPRDELQHGRFVDACMETIALRGRWLFDKQVLMVSLARRFHLLPNHLASLRSSIRAWESQRIL